MELLNEDINIYNGMCTFGVGCKLNLKELQGLPGTDVAYREKPMRVIKKFHNPPATATIYPSGRIIIRGNNSEGHAKKTARKCESELKEIDFNVQFLEYKVVNIFGTCLLPFAISIEEFAEEHPNDASYDPVNHPAVKYKLDQPYKATILIFHTGTITVIAQSESNIKEAMKHIYPLVEVHEMPLTEDMKRKRLARKRKRDEVDEDEEQTSDDEQANECAGDEGAEDEDVGDDDVGDDDVRDDDFGDDDVGDDDVGDGDGVVRDGGNISKAIKHRNPLVEVQNILLPKAITPVKKLAKKPKRDRVDEDEKENTDDKNANGSAGDGPVGDGGAVDGAVGEGGTGDGSAEDGAVGDGAVGDGGAGAEDAEDEGAGR